MLKILKYLMYLMYLSIKLAQRFGKFPEDMLGKILPIQVTECELNLLACLPHTWLVLLKMIFMHWILSYSMSILWYNQLHF